MNKLYQRRKQFFFLLLLIFDQNGFINPPCFWLNSLLRRHLTTDEILEKFTARYVTYIYIFEKKRLVGGGNQTTTSSTLRWAPGTGCLLWCIINVFEDELKRESDYNIVYVTDDTKNCKQNVPTIVYCC